MATRSRALLVLTSLALLALLVVWFVVRGGDAALIDGAESDAFVAPHDEAGRAPAATNSARPRRAALAPALVDGVSEAVESPPVLLTGRVEDAGARPVSGAYVLLQRRWVQPPSGREIRAAMTSAEPVTLRDSCALVRADEEGNFAFAGSVPLGGCFIWAGLEGALTSHMQAVSVPGEQPVVLSLAPAYGAGFKLIDQDGRSVRVSSAFGGGVGANAFRDRIDSSENGGGASSTSGAGPERFRILVSQWGLAPLGEPGPAAYLAGLDPELYGEGGELVAQLFASQRTYPQVGPLSVTARLPGYRMKPAQFMAGPLSDPLPIVWIELERLAEAWTDLELTFVNHAHRADGERCAGLPDLTLQLVGSRGRKDRFPIVGTCDAPVDLTSVPTGSYDLRIESRRFGFTWPEPGRDPARIELVGPRASLEVDLSLECALELSITAADGEPYTGALTAVIGPGAPTLDARGRARVASGRSLRKRGPPYLFEGLRAGLHSVRVYQPHGRTAQGALREPVVLELEPGAAARIELRIVE